MLGDLGLTGQADREEGAERARSYDERSAPWSWSSGP